MSEAIISLRSKGVQITDSEYEAACIGTLLHDIGHTPYSHALESRIVNLDHESISLILAKQMNEEFNGRLSLAIQLLTNNYEKKFLCQLLSSQLDVDRLDYLIRDSFYTGVAEGTIGYERILNTLNVVNNKLVIENKAIHSVEKFLVSRHLMYNQVYMHKTVLALEQMLVLLVKRIKYLLESNLKVELTPPLTTLLEVNDPENDPNFIQNFVLLDDYDLVYVMKMGLSHKDFVFSFLCKCLIFRKIFKIEWIYSDEKRYLLKSKRLELQRSLGVADDESAYLMRSGEESSTSYLLNEEIEILLDNGQTSPLSKLSGIAFSHERYTKGFVCYPRINTEV